MTPDLRSSIVSTESLLGVDLATAISYETAGSFDPWKRGPIFQALRQCVLPTPITPSIPRMAGERSPISDRKLVSKAL